MHGLGVLHLNDRQHDGLDRELPPRPGGEQLDGLDGPVQGEGGQQDHLTRLGQELVCEELMPQVWDLSLLRAAWLLLCVSLREEGDTIRSRARSQGIHWN